MPEVVLAVDLGGTNLRMAAVDREGSVLHLVKRPTAGGVTGEQLAGLFAEMAAENAAATGNSFLAIGVGVPGNVLASGVVHRLPNIPTLEGVDLRSAISEKFDIPVVIDNDATSAAVGETWWGASKGISDSILITLGTGVGGGV